MNTDTIDQATQSEFTPSPFHLTSLFLGGIPFTSIAVSPLGSSSVSSEVTSHLIIIRSSLIGECSGDDIVE